MIKQIKDFLIKLWQLLKKIVLTISSVFYKLIFHLPRFIFILLIILVAYIALYLDEEQEPFQDDLFSPLEQKQAPSQEQVKPKNLLDWSQGDSESYPEEYISKEEKLHIEQERVFHEALSSNIVAFYRNSFVQSYPNSDILVVHTGMAADLANNIKLKYEDATKEVLDEFSRTSDNPSNAPVWSPTMSSGDIEHIISLFQDGSKISVFTPSDTDSVVTREKDPNNTPVSSSAVESSSSGYSVPEKPAVIIVTKRVNEGDPIPPLPSWIGLQFDQEDYHIKKARLTHLINSEYVNNHVDETKPSDRNQEWLNDSKEDLNLDKGLGYNQSDKDRSNEDK